MAYLLPAPACSAGPEGPSPRAGPAGSERSLLGVLSSLSFQPSSPLPISDSAPEEGRVAPSWSVRSCTSASGLGLDAQKCRLRGGTKGPHRHKSPEFLKPDIWARGCCSSLGAQAPEGSRGVCRQIKKSRGKWLEMHVGAPPHPRGFTLVLPNRLTLKHMPVEGAREGSGLETGLGCLPPSFLSSPPANGQFLGTWPCCLKRALETKMSNLSSDNGGQMRWVQSGRNSNLPCGAQALPSPRTEVLATLRVSHGIGHGQLPAPQQPRSSLSRVRDFRQGPRRLQGPLWQTGQ